MIGEQRPESRKAADFHGRGKTGRRFHVTDHKQEVLDNIEMRKRSCEGTGVATAVDESNSGEDGRNASGEAYVDGREAL